MSRMKLQPKPFKKRFVIPIYGAVFWLIVAKDIYKARKRMSLVFGEPQKCDYTALCSYSGGNTFGIFMNPEDINFNVVSHEVFHLTHRILDWAGANFDAEHHEQGALLCGFLTQLVMQNILPPKRKRK